MRNKHPKAEEGNTVSFCFKDQDKRFVGLLFERMKMSYSGWIVESIDGDKKVCSLYYVYLGATTC